jgi:hypothetical protein
MAIKHMYKIMLKLVWTLKWCQILIGVPTHCSVCPFGENWKVYDM